MAGAFAILAAAAAIASGQADDTLVFKPIAARASAGQVEVYHGVDADERDWPTVMSANAEHGACTATLIGLNTVLTAAHCFDRSDNTVRPARLEREDASWSLSCQLATAYLARKWQGPKALRTPADYALCLLTPIKDAGPYAPGVTFETLDLAPLESGEAVLLVGWGCASMSSTNGTVSAGQDGGKLRLGDTTIYSTADSDNPTVATLSVGNQPALCPGDSGGPLVSAASASEPHGPDGARRVRGVASTVASTAYEGEPAYQSTLAALSDPAFLAFATKWLKDKTATICGLPTWPGGEGRCL